MSSVMISNPGSRSVKVRLVSLDAAGAAAEPQSVASGGLGFFPAVPGRYTLRYQFADSDQVFEGDKFTVSAASSITITLKATSGGNYGTHRFGGSL